MNYNISELKKSLGNGLGLRKNKYLIEIPVPTVSGETLNILCQSASLPEKSINVSEVWHKGRKYNVRGETDYLSEYEITIMDDDKMKIRQLFDTWLKQIDDSRPDNHGGLLGASFEQIAPGLIDDVTNGVAAANALINSSTSQQQTLDFAIGILDSSIGKSASYQTDVNIWQLDGKNEKVYGYKLQNAFPKLVGNLSLDDSEENTLSTFNITFAFSEFIPLKNNAKTIIDGVLGGSGGDLVTGISDLV